MAVPGTNALTYCLDFGRSWHGFGNNFEALRAGIFLVQSIEEK
jgi:hypothetical protein